jgi:hypothetical protein
MKSQTRSSRWRARFSSSLWITMAVMALAAEKRLKGVSIVAGRFGASGWSFGPLPDA